MDPSGLERAARLRAIAAQFRDFAAQTQLPDYRDRMQQLAADLDQEAATLDGGRPLAWAS